MNQTRVLISGGGIAGLSAAYHLLELHGFEDFTVLESEQVVGGTSRSFRTADGFVFDYGSHLLYTKSDYVAKLYREILNGEFDERVREAWIYSSGRFSRFPFQAKLYGLPLPVVAKCIWGYLSVQRSDPRSAPDFEEWLNRAFGPGIMRYFMGPFNKKHWKYPLDQMSHGWLSPYIARPTILDVLRGAILPDGKRYGANAVFWYPRSGGIGAVPDGMLRLLGPHSDKVKTNSAIRWIDIEQHVVGLQDGETTRYGAMVYTLPLPALLELAAADPPRQVQAALERLEYNRQYCLCFGVRGRRLDRWMRLYLPEQRFLAHRLGFPQAISPDLAPEGWGAVYAEITEARAPTNPLTEAEMVDKTIADMGEIGVIDADDTVEYKGCITIDPAYVIFTQSHHEDVDLIRGYLVEHGIYTAGRYADWRYYAIDHTILSAKAAVERVMQGLEVMHG